MTVREGRRAHTLRPSRDTAPRRVAVACGLVTLLLLPSAGWAHAFVSRSDPSAGVSLNEAPAQVRIWFDGPVEPVFLDLRVENDDKRRVDKANGRLSPADNRLVEVGLLPLTPGRYRVFWSVIARDGHRREGNFSFLVK